MEQYQSRNPESQQTDTIKSKLEELIHLLRHGEQTVPDLQDQKLYATSAEVLDDVLKSFSAHEMVGVMHSEEEADYYQSEEQPEKTWPQQQAPLK